jgi:hypothetical protein
MNGVERGNCVVKRLRWGSLAGQKKAKKIVKTTQIFKKTSSRH